MATASKKVDMISGSLFVNIFKFALPFMLTGLLQQFYNAADVIVVGRYAGRAALAGVGTSGSINSLIINLVLGLSVGISVTIGRSLGAKDDKTTHKIVHTGMMLALVCGAFVTVVGVVFAEPLLKLIDAEGEVLQQATIYLRILFLGKTFVLIYNFGAAMLRAKGETKKPLYIIMISGIINVVLNIIFVRFFGMAADGVALATVISQIFNATSVIYFLVKSEDSTRLYIRKLKIYKEELINIIKIGVPSAIQSITFALSNTIVQRGVNSLGDVIIAGNSASNNIGNFLYVALNTFYQATVAFVSQNMGARRFDRIKKIVGVSLIYCVITWAIEAGIVLLLAKVFIGFYAPEDAEVIAAGVFKLTLIGSLYGLCGLMETMSGALRGLGYSTSSMIISIIGVCGIRITWVMTVFAHQGTFASLIMCMPLSWLGTFLLHSALFLYVSRRHRLVSRAH